MLLVDLLLVTLLALAFTALFMLVGARLETQWSWLSLFLVFLFGGWALAVWFRPIGPPIRGVYWGSFLTALVVVAIILAVARSLPRSLRDRSREELRGKEIRPVPPEEPLLEGNATEAAVATSWGAVFWLLIILAVVAIAVHYAFPQLG